MIKEPDAIPVRVKTYSDKLQISPDYHQNHESPLLFTADFHHILNNLMPKRVNHQLSSMIYHLQEDERNLLGCESFHLFLTFLFIV